MSTNKRVTNKDIVKALETILSTVVETSPNGTLDKIKDKVNSLISSQKEHSIQMDKKLNEVNTSIHKLEKRLYNPDDGIIVQLKDTTRIATETQKSCMEKLETLDKIEDNVDKLKEWKTTTIKFLIILIPGMLSLIGWVVAKLLS